LEEGADLIILDTNKLKIYNIFYLNGNPAEWILDNENEIENFGAPLIIFLDRNYQTGEEFKILIEYETLGNPKAIHKIEKERTASKKFPFFYTECSGIGARSTFPCQVGKYLIKY
jgi:leukotriene-A4 hydrolase